MDKDNVEIESIVYNFIDKMKELLFKSQKTSALFDFSKNEILALFYIYRKNEVNVSEVAEYIDAPLNTATGVINRLEKKNILERKRDTQDKRVVKIYLTKYGKELFEEEKDILFKYFISVYDLLTEEEISAVLSIIDKIMKVFKDTSISTTEEEIKTSKRIKRIVID